MNTEIFLTDRCNMQCSFCGAWNQNGVCNNLDPETIRAYLTELHDKGYRYLSLSGGEPFLYDHLYDVIGFANQKGFLINVTTNGLLIDRDYVSFVRNKNVITRISLHTLNRDLYRQLTGVDKLDRIMQSVDLLKDEHALYGLGMTVSGYNMAEVYDLANYALVNNAEYIRFTPVYRVYKGTDFSTGSESFLDLLNRITRFMLDHYDKLECKRRSTVFDKEILDIYTTKPCGAGSAAYVALNPDLTLVGCPVLPHYFDVPTGQFASCEDVFALRQKYEALLDSIRADQLKGRCADCLYKTSCKGGCISIKLENGLSLTDEQPVCINEIICRVLSHYSEDEQQKIINYWNEWHQKRSVGTGSKGCIRRLPVWELYFRKRNDPKMYYRR